MEFMINDLVSFLGVDGEVVKGEIKKKQLNNKTKVTNYLVSVVSDTLNLSYQECCVALPESALAKYVSLETSNTTEQESEEDHYLTFLELLTVISAKLDDLRNPKPSEMEILNIELNQQLIKQREVVEVILQELSNIKDDFLRVQVELQLLQSHLSATN